MTDTRKGSQLALYRGDVATATNFQLICGINVTNRTTSRGQNERTGRACTAFSEPYIMRTSGALDSRISGSGFSSIDDAAGLDIDDLHADIEAGVARYWKVEVEDGPTWVAKYNLANIEETADASTTENPEQTMSIELNLADGSTYARTPAA